MRAKKRALRKQVFKCAGVMTAMCGWFLLSGLWGTGQPQDSRTIFTSQAAEELHCPPAQVIAAIGAAPALSADGGTDDRISAEAAAVSAPRPADWILTAAPEGYFDDALFIGDSRTQGLELYGDIDEATYFAAQGLMVNTALVKAVAEVDGQQMSIPEALGKRSFGKVYIMLGVNELGWKSQDRFIQYYSELVETIREKQPGAVIYAQSLLPFSREKSESDEVYNNTRIALYNECIQQAIEGRGVIWLDVGAALRDENGCMPENSTFDGVHLKPEYCKKWEAFLRGNVAAAR